ncbi:hypothetical protein B0H21DRAFT_720437 [Amylocystis lapponica]|nr:hypothetical protein B0H21DRAFT_720437 [Amylocystis lapponica]
MSTTTTGVAPILLSPRPLERISGSIILVPLLPYKPPAEPLPPEIWTKIIAYVFQSYANDNSQSREKREALGRGLLVVCKDLTAVALPLFYARIYLSVLSSLEMFTRHVHHADQKWDSIRRIPYSTPGRWVQKLDLRDLHITQKSQAYRLDNALSQLFPLLPFLVQLVLNPTITPSRRVWTGLLPRDGMANLRYLKGVRLDVSHGVDDDPMIQLLRSCVNLEELGVVGSGIEMLDVEEYPPSSPITPLELPHLRKLTMLSIPRCPLMLVLLNSPLPALRHLTITPYDELSIPTSLAPRFIHTHGQGLASLHLFTQKFWPSMMLPSPVDLLHTCPNLYHLSLENPLPPLSISSIYPKHPLRVLSIPRPYAEFLPILESLLPKLPSLKTVRARDVRWLRRGMSSHAQQAGVQGEMMEWRRRLARRSIQMVDSEWSTGNE